MKKTREIGVGLLGFGTVGAGVVKALTDNGALIARRLGARLVLRGIADLDVTSDRGVPVDRALLTTDAKALIASPKVDVVVELIGGTGIARELVKRALSLGKPVVTANKALLAEHGEEIFGLARRKRADIYFGASVGGGIPIIRALREGLIANNIESLHGIVNGTCNYILTRMESAGLPFDQALAEAQAKGYAEANPGLDIDGFDTAHKAVILASLAHGFHVPMQAVHIEGIRGLSETDIRYALDLGYRIKLLAVIKRHASAGGNAVEVRVHPTLVPLSHVLASVGGVFNAVMVRGDFSGDTLYYGRGAGRMPTASTVTADICDAARNLASGASGRVPALTAAGAAAKIVPISAVTTRYYLRLLLRDKPGVLARFAAVLGKHGISLASVMQKENVGDSEFVSAVMLTHKAREKDMAAALRRTDGMDFTGAKTVRLRIEE